ncbi:glycine betaine/proline transport system substrate-binding protein [Nakamurella sp. UYEF19]|uniref:ABC transporter substrate-binding protein n=1 Tax=Nakamurella sp. UYEF19 TaxID=1756392 RepID=UPI003393DAC3
MSVFNTRSGIIKGSVANRRSGSASRSGRRIGVGTAIAALLLSACGGATVNGATSAAPAAGSSTSAAVSGSSAPAAAACGTVNLAMNDWVGYTADAAVYTYIAENSLGCKVNQKALKEEIAWQGFPTGQIDVIMENWGHDDLIKKYITEQKVAQDAGYIGNVGQIGWYVPPWMATKYPDILDYKSLNKYADMFKTSESGGVGQFLDGDPSFVTNDEALVTNLKLNYKVVYAGSEAALIQSFRTAEANKTPLIGYFYAPQWFLSEVKLARVTLPAYTTGCDAVAAKIACDYPEDKLNKIIGTKFATSGSPAVSLIKKFNWTNDDQNTVAAYITADKMTPAAAAKKWVDANQVKVKAWLK